MRRDLIDYHRKLLCKVVTIVSLVKCYFRVCFETQLIGFNIRRSFLRLGALFGFGAFLSLGALLSLRVLLGLGAFLSIGAFLSFGAFLNIHETDVKVALSFPINQLPRI